MSSRDDQKRPAAVGGRCCLGSRANEKRRVPSFLGDWQLGLNYNDLEAVIPGLGPPLAATVCLPCGGDDEEKGRTCSNSGSRPLDFGTYAQNFLHASAVAEQIMYNVAAGLTGVLLQRHRRRGRVVLPHHVRPAHPAGGVAEPRRSGHYHGCHARLHTPSTLSTRSFRQVDVLRLVFDGVLGLWGDTPAMSKMKEQDNDALQGWAKRSFRLVYRGRGGRARSGEVVETRITLRGDAYCRVREGLNRKDKIGKLSSYQYLLRHVTSRDRWGSGSKARLHAMATFRAVVVDLESG